MMITPIQTNKANAIIASYFAQFVLKALTGKVLAGKPIYKSMPNKVIVQIPYYAYKGDTAAVLSESKINALGAALTMVLSHNSNCQCEVRLVRLRYPYLDSKILSQYLAINAGKYSFTRLQKEVFSQVPTVAINNVLPITSASTGNQMTNNLLAGVKLESAGRLTTQRNILRKTVNNAYTGSFTVSDNLGSSLDFSQYTTKNKLGAYTVKV